MEFHRYEYSEFDLTTYYAVEDGVTKAHVNCEGVDDVARTSTRPVPEPLGSDVIGKDEVPENVQQVFDTLLEKYV